MRNSHKGVELDSQAEQDLIKEFNSLVDHEVLRSLELTGEIKNPEDPWYTQRVLTRYLRAEKHDLASANTRLAKHALWREEHRPADITEESVAGQISQDKVLLQPCGKDGRPLLVIRVCRHQAVSHIDQLEKFVTYCLEAAASSCDHRGNPDGKLWALFDLDGVKWANMDAHALHSCFRLLNLAYPERVCAIYMLNSPYMFDALYKLVRPFIDPVSRDKVRFISGKKGHDEIFSVVDANIVPVAFGGKAEEVPVAVAVRKLRGEIKSNGVEKRAASGDEEQFYDASDSEAAAS